ncbi:MAG: DUF4352 domain-containing protein [Candidatus Altiarchaeota archaeon]
MEVKSFLSFFLVFTLFSGFSSGEIISSEKNLVIVANSIDSSLAGDLFSLLEAEGIPFVLATPGTLDVNQQFILVLGGHKAPEGVGDLVTGILSDEQKEILVSTDDSIEFFVFDGFFTEGQRIWVAAGFDRFGTKRSWEGNVSEVISYFRNANVSIVVKEEEVEVLVLKVNDHYSTDVIMGKATSGFVQKDMPRFGYEFVIVNLTLENHGNETVEYSTRDFRVESGKQSFGRSLVKYLKWSLKGKYLEPGGVVTGLLAFEVPEHREGFSLVYSCSMHPRCERMAVLD